MKNFYRSVLLFAGLAVPFLAACSSPVAAQFRQAAPWFSGAAVAPAGPATLTEASVRRPGFAGAVLGAALGTAAAFPLFLVAAMEEGGCHPRGAELSCYTPMIPLALGAGLGASAGSTLGNGQAAWGHTLLGSSLGAALGAAVILSDSAPVDGSSVLFGIIAPAVGAVIGNRVGQW